MSNVTMAAVHEMTNEQLVARIRAGVDEADNMLQLYKQNKGFIYKTAMRYSEHAEIDDLMQEGYIGLCEAVRHYDAEYGAQFLSYAAFWINQTMVRYLENCGSMVRIPSGTNQQLLKYKKIYGEYLKWYGKDPTDAEMRAFLGISQEKLEDIKKDLGMTKIRSLSETIGDEEESSLGDFVASSEDLEEDAINRIDRERMAEALWEIIDALPGNQGYIIRKRYLDGMTLEEIGKIMGVGRERIRQEEVKALRDLRRPRKRNQIFKAYHEEYLSPAPIYHVGVETFNRTWTSSVEAQALGL